MTAHQRAYDLIDQLGEDDVQAIIQVMIRLLPTVKQEKKETSTDSISHQIVDKAVSASNCWSHFVLSFNERQACLSRITDKKHSYRLEMNGRSMRG